MVITGIIRPPPEIRTVADRTALYVSKNGRAFEQRIVNSAKGKTPKFAFLQEVSPFHAYYEQRIEFYLNGGTDEKDEDKKSENKTDAKDTSQDDAAVATKQTTQQESAVKSAVLDPVAKALLAQKAKIQKARADQERAQNGDNGDSGDAIKPAVPVSIVPPPPLQFVNLVAPSNLSLAQLEVIQLVAQLTAMDGKHGPFLSQLTLREWNNPAFAFCQPRHGQFAYFSALVDAYRRVLGLWTLPSSQNARQQGDNVPTLAGNVPACLEHAA